MAGHPRRKAQFQAELGALLRAEGPLPGVVTESAYATQLQTELVRVLREYGGLSTEATWEHLAETVAAHFLTIQGQSPLSTFNMLATAGRMVLLIRMARGKGQGAERALELSAFQELMASVFAEEGARVRNTPVDWPGATGASHDEAVEDEGDEEDE